MNDPITNVNFGQEFDRIRARLRRMVNLRLDPHLRGRIDASDVVQESYLEATQRLPEYIKAPDMPFFLWVRFLTGQKLLELHRRHLTTQGRDARREIPLEVGGAPEASSILLADAIAASASGSPSRVAARHDEKQSLLAALDQLDPQQREVLMQRHFEGLGNREIAQILGISPSAASQRYLTAMKHLGKILQQSPQRDD